MLLFYRSAYQILVLAAQWRTLRVVESSQLLSIAATGLMGCKTGAVGGTATPSSSYLKPPFHLRRCGALQQVIIPPIG
jgi:hypothetical protein